ncbi:MULTISPECIES: hypothetical protein [unclassified Lysobacter]|uniref:hypothetical protein n=1 Tax=unclassified Lysobacter TaxID=2635362 RepID=UPI001BE654ED|nr:MULTISPECIES: hypothetical protein [unclassified Lysobacter]MBT2748357.1 hypothetical protein [Lysobacter sp. ISL-42]MBT2749876.1 hypothetical protein [Lysobacter sp. ISL-50]MBT2781204.1 hypothetical protein [Lysobacter sp. ISL-52]
MSEYYRDFHSTAKYLQRYEVCIHDLLQFDDTEQMAAEDLDAAKRMARSCWAVVMMLCEKAQIELPKEPDFDPILDEVNEVAANR